jgi:DNA-binding transcriptional regulator GbsR (MarR family)
MARRGVRPEMSHDEIAEELGMSIGAVTMTLSRALRKLRRQGLLKTAKELAEHLDRNRATGNTVRRPGRSAQ